LHLFLNLLILFQAQRDAEGLVLGKSENGEYILKLYVLSCLLHALTSHRANSNNEDIVHATLHTTPPPKTGDVVTFTYTAHSKLGVPTNAKIALIRDDWNGENSPTNVPRGVNGCDTLGLFHLSIYLCLFRNE
jgi:hypothetical protein